MKVMGTDLVVVVVFFLLNDNYRCVDDAGGMGLNTTIMLESSNTLKISYT